LLIRRNSRGLDRLKLIFLDKEGSRDDKNSMRQERGPRTGALQEGRTRGSTNRSSIGQTLILTELRSKGYEEKKKSLQMGLEI